MRTSALLLLLAGCVSRIYPVGGTPGGPAIDCAASDGTCREVVRALEIRRRNIGGWCGTSNHLAYSILYDQGPVALPYLVRAFDDRDTEVAEMALRASVELGAIDPVIDWCTDAHDLVRIGMCRRVL